MRVYKLAEQLHKWYLEGIKNYPDSFNIEAQKDYWKLTDEQRTVDIFIADRILKNFISKAQHEKELLVYGSKITKEANKECIKIEIERGKLVLELKHKEILIKQYKAQLKDLKDDLSDLFADFKNYKAEVKKKIDEIIQSIDNDCLKLKPSNDYEEGIRLNLQGVKMQLEELKKKLKEAK